MPQTMQPKRSETNASPQRTQSRPKPVFRFSVSYFLGALVLNIFISPIVDRLRSGTLIETMLITLLLLCAVLSIAGGRRALVGVVLVAPAAIGEWLNYWRPELLIYVVTRGVGLLFTNNQQRPERIRTGPACHSRSATCRCENAGSSPGRR